MPAGNAAAGIQPAGYDPRNAPAPGQRKLPPRAVNYDPRIRDFTTTVPVTGGLALYDAVHPVDQQVVLALTIDLGSLTSAPTVGNTYRQIQTLGIASLQNQVEDRTRAALKKLTDAQKIKILAIETDLTAAKVGQLKIAVTYVNLLTAKIVKRAVTPTNA